MNNKKAGTTFGLGGYLVLGILAYLIIFTKLSIANLFSNPIAIAIAVIVFVVISTNNK